LTAELLAACSRSGHARFHSFADEVAFKFRDAGEKGRQHPSMRRRQVERHAVQGDEAISRRDMDNETLRSIGRSYNVSAATISRLSL
jgi:hypothetical protein